MGRAERKLKTYYNILYKNFGPQHWWPARTRFEVIVGAILTQNTAWTNVEKAIRNLKSGGNLDPRRLHALGLEELASLIRPAGYFNVKAKRLKNFTSHLFDNYGGDLDKFLRYRDGALRDELLSINGIGPETADSIALYAGSHPEFVVDAYTKRIFSRHAFFDADAAYDDVKEIFASSLPKDARLFNEYHALIVKTGKEYCRAKDPLCGNCPLKRFLR